MDIKSAKFPELCRNDFITVGVQFYPDGQYVNTQNLSKDPTGKIYTYKAPKGMAIEIGIQLVVETGTNNAHTSLRIVRVVEVNEIAQIDVEASFEYKWIVGRFNTIMESYNANVRKDYEIKEGLRLLRSALDRQNTREQLTRALNLLSEDEKTTVSKLFGPNILGIDTQHPPKPTE